VSGSRDGVVVLVRLKAVPAAIQASRGSAPRRASLRGSLYTARRGTRTHERANDTSHMNTRRGNWQGSRARWDRAVPAAASLAPPRWYTGRVDPHGWMFVPGRHKQKMSPVPGMPRLDD
jgi:hypothetical protein